MKVKYLLVTVAALVAAAAWWLSHRPAFHNSNIEVRTTIRPDETNRNPMLRPPDPNRKFRQMTPEERVKLARRGPIGG